jgi:hypothetical protein
MRRSSASSVLGNRHLWPARSRSCLTGALRRVDGAAQQGVEADEAWSTLELRSLTPVLDGPVAGPRNSVATNRLPLPGHAETQAAAFPLIARTSSSSRNPPAHELFPASHERVRSSRYCLGLRIASLSSEAHVSARGAGTSRAQGASLFSDAIVCYGGNAPGVERCCLYGQEGIGVTIAA